MNEPEKSGRYLLLIKCPKGIHNCSAIRYSRSCCKWNILYYALYDKRWSWGTSEPLEDYYTPIAWTELPEIPKELMKYEKY